MNLATLQKLIADAINENVFSNWRFYAALISVAILCSVITAFIQGWGKKKGETAATKADFDEIMRQLRESTITAKSVELALSQNDWIQREKNALRRMKLEQLLTAAFAIASWVRKEAPLASSNVDHERNGPVDEFEMLSKLYFPELNDECRALEDSYREAVDYFMGVRIFIQDSTIRFDRAIELKQRHDLQDIIDERKDYIESRIHDMKDRSLAVDRKVQSIAKSAHDLMEKLTANPSSPV
jgi:low affinity Fe/Cu permease